MPSSFHTQPRLHTSCTESAGEASPFRSRNPAWHRSVKDEREGQNVGDKKRGEVEVPEEGNGTSNCTIKGESTGGGGHGMEERT